MPPEVLIVALAKSLIEVAGLMFLLRGFVWLFYAKARKDNFVYGLITTGVMPFIKVTRKITPQFVSDGLVPAIAFFLLFWIWVGLALLQQAITPGEGL